MPDLAPPPTAAPPGFAVSRPWTAPVTVGALAVVGTAGLAVVDPTSTHVPLCPLRALTGLDCPLCGSLRAVHSLTRADVVQALDHNLLFTASVPLLTLLWVWWLVRATGPDARPGLPLPPRAGPAVLAIGLAFAVARNLPAFGWLASGA